MIDKKQIIMQSLSIFCDNDELALQKLLKEVIESTGKFTVLIEDDGKCIRLKEKFREKLSTKLILFGDFSFNTEIRTLQWRQEKPMSVTIREREILLLLLQNAGSLVRRSLILTSFWHENSFYTSRSLDLFICQIRKLLKCDSSVTLKTIRGEGFLLTY